MKRLAVFAVLLAVMLSLIAACDGAAEDVTSGAAKDALSAVRHDLGDADNAQLEADTSKLDGIPSGDFKGNDLQLRSALLTRTATDFLEIWSRAWAHSHEETLPQEAGQTAEDTAQDEATEQFLDALTAVTQDAIRGKTCDLILNQVAPDPDPSATSTPDDQDWQGDIAQDADDVLAKTFDPDGIAQVMDWSEWTDEVTSAAQQAAASVSSDPVPYIQFLANPEGRRATAVYVKYCYAPPTAEE
jgi:hypothetical protein